MNRDEVRKLLGGYATGTLTDAEQETLFAAALEDQELFEEMVKEQPVRDLLRDPAAKAELLAALDGGEKRAWWQWRPLAAALAMAGIAMVTVVMWRGALRKETATFAELRQTGPVAIDGTPERALREQAASPSAPRPPERQRAQQGQQGQQAQVKTEKDVIASTGNLRRQFEAPAPAAAPAPPPITTEQPAIAQAKPAEVVLPAPLAPPPVQGFRDSQSGAAGAVGGLPQFGVRREMEKKQAADAVAPPARPAVRNINATAEAVSVMGAGIAAILPCRILRNGREVAPETVLDSGDTVQLRIMSFQNGSVRVEEGTNVLAEAAVTAGKAFDTPRLTFSASGAHALRVIFTRVKSTEPPVIVPVTLTFK